jgi:hypothetical protein
MVSSWMKLTTRRSQEKRRLEDSDDEDDDDDDDDDKDSVSGDGAEATQEGAQDAGFTMIDDEDLALIQEAQQDKEEIPGQGAEPAERQRHGKDQQSCPGFILKRFG